MGAVDILRPHGLAETFWGQRICVASMTGGFNDSDMEHASKPVVCAQGGTGGVEFAASGIPADLIMAHLSAGFGLYGVYANDYEEAAIIMVLIEIRRTELLQRQAQQVQQDPRANA